MITSDALAAIDSITAKLAELPRFAAIAACAAPGTRRAAANDRLTPGQILKLRQKATLDFFLLTERVRLYK